MGRIPQDELDRIKREVSIADLARRRGVELKPHGKDLIGLCPFHNDTNPSLVISTINLWHCLGACQAGGDVIAWVRKAEGVSFRQAVELLRRHDVALTPATARAVVKVGTVKKLPCPIADDVVDQTALHQVVNFYNETLKDSPEALAYLEKRRIGHAGALDHFKLGYANRTLGYYLPDPNRDAGAKIRGQLQRLGVYRANGREHFNGSLVIPVIDEQGNVTEMYGRKIRDDLRDGTAYHLYLPGSHKGVWNISSLAASKEVILCEALIDALTFWCAGYRNVTASYGIEGFNGDHLAAFKKYGIEKVLIAYDRDAAGERAASKLAPALIEHGFEVFRVDFADGQDANSFACAVDDPSDALGQVLRGATWIGKGQRASVVSMPAAAAKKEDSLPLAAEEAPPVVESLTPAPPDPAASDLPTCAPPEAVAEPEAAANSSGNGHPLDETFDGRAWRIRGLDKNTSYGTIKVSVRVSCGERYHMDTPDLANANQRTKFLKEAAHEMNLSENLLKDDLRKLLLKLEEMQDALIQKKLSPQSPPAAMTDAEREEALAFLKSPDLLDRITADFEACGIVGERTTLLVGYIAAVSRKLETPLGLLIQSSTAAGKTAIMDAILSLMPPEDVVKLSAMTGQALFYLDDVDLRHKILAIAEEAGCEKADYAIKLLISDGKLSIASTMKDAKTGNLIARQKEKPGPTMYMSSTTAHEVNEEKANRLLTLTVNEDRDQTRRIHELQRESQTLPGLLRRQARETIRRRHQNAQRLLRPFHVAMPEDLANRLRFPDTCLRMRRDHMKYLTMIHAIALLHQHQRPWKQITANGEAVTFIEVTPEDIALANRLADEVLGRSLDEMAPQTRRFLELIDEMVTARCEKEKSQRADVRFNRRDAREYTRRSSTEIHRHLKKLEDLEYVLLHRGGRGLSFEYELLYDGRGKDGRRFCMGLIDVSTPPAAPSHDYDADHSRKKPGYSVSIPSQFRGNSVGIPTAKIGAILTASKASRALLQNWAKTHILGNGRRRTAVSS